MSTQPFDVGLVIARLREKVPQPPLRLIGGSADFAPLASSLSSTGVLKDFPAPCAYVLLGREKAVETKSGISESGKQTPLAQRVEVTFAVAVAFRNYRQLEGEDLRNELRDQLGAIRKPLLGWTPSVTGGRACQLVQGDLTAYDGTYALWTDVWKTQHIIQAEITP